MGSWPRRLLDVATTAGRHVVPLNGIFGGGWQPATAIAVYWLESLVLVLTTATLCWLVQRRTSDRVIAAARVAGDHAAVAALEAERRVANGAGVKAGDVLMVHLSSVAIFGVFMGVMVTLVITNGNPAPFDATEFQTAVYSMLLVLGAGWAIDVAMSPAMSVAAVADRVEGCMGRWGLLWTLCFFGTILPIFIGRPQLFLEMFAVLKVVSEGWSMLARLFGWKSLRDRQAESALRSAAGVESPAPRRFP